MFTTYMNEALAEATKALERGEIPVGAVVVGSSGNVYPAAGLVNLASNFGAHTILFNLEEPINSNEFEEIIVGPAGTTLSKWVNKINNYENQ